MIRLNRIEEDLTRTVSLYLKRTNMATRTNMADRQERMTVTTTSHVGGANVENCTREKQRTKR